VGGNLRQRQRGGDESGAKEGDGESEEDGGELLNAIHDDFSSVANGDAVSP
jgi:hypothetical protein